MMNTNTVSDANGPGSPYDPFPTPRIYPDKWDLSELAPSYHSMGDITPELPPASTAGQTTNPMVDRSTDESTANAL